MKIYLVDDMFVLLRAYELTSTSLPIPERIALTMQRGGISILFTSITDLIAFCVGAVSPLSDYSYIFIRNICQNNLNIFSSPKYEIVLAQYLHSVYIVELECFSILCIKFSI